MSASVPTRTGGVARTPGPSRPGPHLRHERAALREGAVRVAGMDEVGRGSLAGPVSVGVVVVDATTRTAPRGVADSKLLTPAARRALLPALGRWGLARAVGHASAAEIDALGIVAALRLAGTRALVAATAVSGPVDLVILDGSHDWLTPPADLFSAADPPADEAPPPAATGPRASVPTLLPALLPAPVALPVPDPVPDPGTRPVPASVPPVAPGLPAGFVVPRVRMRVKADRSCASVAAASVLAKCERDALMVALAPDHPAYRWEDNKGYAAPEHVDALRRLGPSPWHRRSWRLPGLPHDDGSGPGPDVAVPDGLVGASVTPGLLDDGLLDDELVDDGLLDGDLLPDEEPSDGRAAWGMMGA
ncbi:ribonuclease HII [Cellulomonas marina]|uniref:Ribonuclease n=1 Tax=Cellulomonas marina TaxID=988821 RepID=A0A1I0VEG8_9CELL|nr:ribonuclease HII [Cellulomonas marina]GIG28013.1 hypothetical protein Cma02nite_06130 [Cellulomonas marina]SFA74744.1 ribonuclease HII [Cellulomonas marina]